MKKGLSIAPKHFQLVQKILQDYFSKPVKIWVFGSRATGKARKYSDLDLAIDAGRLLSLKELAALSYAFEESLLPYKVDIVDLKAINPAFRARIEADRISFELRSEQNQVNDDIY